MKFVEVIKNEVNQVRFKKLLCVVSCVFAFVAASPATVMAHGVWLQNRLDQVQLVLGEGFKDNAYDPGMVTSLKGYDAQYNAIPVKAIGEGDYITVINQGDHISIKPTERTSVVTLSFDFGYWTFDTHGKLFNRPMDRVKDAKIGTHAIKYSVNYLGSVDKVEPFPDIPYQIVPMTDPTKLHVGDKLTVQVLHEGKPMGNVDIIPDVTNHHTVTMKTDADGKAVVSVANGGINVVGMEMPIPYEGNDKKASRSKVFSSLSFTMYPEESD